MKNQSLITQVCTISKQAGAAILEVYHREGEIDVTHKGDDSPLTQADLNAHKIIETGLLALDQQWPVLSEESDEISWQERRQWQTYWLVDPLDGTKEFVKRNGEFTVNIALIENGIPILGVVYVPVLDILYYGSRETGAYKQDESGLVKIRTKPLINNSEQLNVVASSNYRGETLDAWIAKAGQKFPKVELLCMGSSLKICLVAEGKADIYPRLALTSEWDTGAAQAILEAAGGILTDTNHKLYRYNQKEDILNPYFFAIGDKDFPWNEI